MILGRVLGNVISTQKDGNLQGFKLQVVQPIDAYDLAPRGNAIVAVDTAGAGCDDVVMVVSGSSARQTSQTKTCPVDMAIVAIVDTVEIQGKKVYGK
ncbi:MAG: EutN/CcmL family microcompartment protein [Limnochordia bacterium]|jgi:microcompartment protein CcmK/EutM|nr:EutN/CcmL family microcompartment protein [Limnochordia bacterium]